MLTKFFVIFSLCLSLAPLEIASADSSVRVLSSKTVNGSRIRIFTNGDSAPSGTLWTAKIPTKIRLNHDSSGYGGMVLFKIRNTASGEESSQTRISITLWSAGGKKISNHKLFDWSPVSSTTDLDYPIYGDDQVRPGKYVWVIETTNYLYDGKGEVKVPVLFN